MTKIMAVEKIGFNWADESSKGFFIWDQILKRYFSNHIWFCRSDRGLSLLIILPGAEDKIWFSKDKGLLNQIYQEERIRLEF